jgi:hypothetical protein
MQANMQCGEIIAEIQHQMEMNISAGAIKRRKYKKIVTSNRT